MGVGVKHSERPVGDLRSHFEDPSSLRLPVMRDRSLGGDRDRVNEA